MRFLPSLRFLAKIIPTTQRKTVCFDECADYLVNEELI